MVYKWIIYVEEREEDILLCFLEEPAAGFMQMERKVTKIRKIPITNNMDDLPLRNFCQPTPLTYTIEREKAATLWKRFEAVLSPGISFALTETTFRKGHSISTQAAFAEIINPEYIQTLRQGPTYG